MTQSRFFHLHLVSDATGETLNAVARAAAAQYSDHRPVEHIYALVRTPKQLHRVLSEVEQQPGVVLFTIIDADIRRQLETKCAELSIPCISILDPVIASLGHYLNARHRPQVGRQHAMNDEYFKRIDALNYSMAHDDGQHPEGLDHAEVILVGISRTSKTPTSIYLANRGVMVANVPLVLDQPYPPELDAIETPLVVGLVATTERIAQIRKHRLLGLNENRDTDYVDHDKISAELMHMRKLCARKNWPLIDVTRRSIEETSAAIINLLNERKSDGQRIDAS
jgi:[pyruvate, water dikinase]-phosphate phosphotransferase / [pyruvate, water dikinase] kinase